MKKHSEYSKELIPPFFGDKVKNIVIQHHERVDGSGYPNGLKGEEISPEAQVLMIADVFDALTLNRVYRKKYRVKDALDIMDEDVAEGKLDKEMFGALKRCIDKKTIVVK